MMQIKKRNGNIVDFDSSKIKNAIKHAFESQKQEYNPTVFDNVMDSLYCKFMRYKIMDVEQVQDTIERTLMDFGYYRVMKAFILYREEHKNARFIRERIDYMDEYSESLDNAATSSETDPNANITVKNVANLEGEVYKTTNRIIQRQRMKDKLKVMYPELADQYEKDLNHHIIYTNDEASTPTTKFYCQAVSLYPLMTEGVGNIDGVTPSAPNDMQSFSGQITNLAFLLSSQCKGAVACLYGKQPIVVNNYETTIKDFVNKNWNNPIVANDGWEYCNVNGDFVFEDGKNVLIKKVFKKRYSEKIYKIKSKKGFVAYVSKDHKFKTLRRGVVEEIEAENLHLYDTVFVNNDFIIDFNSKEYKEGWIKGMLLGDGCLTQPGMIQLSVNYNQDYYGNIFNEYCQCLYNNQTYRCKGNKCYQYEARNKDFINNLKSGIDGKNCYNKNISINNKNLEYISGILDGLLCADGGDYNSIGISLANKQLIDTIIKILNVFRIKYSYKEIPEHDNKSRLYCLSICTEVLKYTPNFKLKLKKDKKAKDVYYYSGYSRIRNVSNKERVRSTKKDGFAFKEYKLDVITEIETFNNDDEFVYEIETESHWYNCGGFITHNCGEYFLALNYYVISEFGEKWYDKLDCSVTTDHCLIHRTVRDSIYKAFKQFVWGINQPAGNRGYQSPFINVSYFDKTYFESLFNLFYYPDGTQPEWKAIDTLQRLFMKWFNKVREKQVLAFPVETFAMVHDGKDIIDKEYKDLCAEMYAEGHSFFTYISDSADSLASCCRLRNELAENTFSPTSGLTGVMTGSCNVITLNISRIVQDCDKYYGLIVSGGWKFNAPYLKDYLKSILERVYKYHIAFKTMLYELEDKGMFSSSNGGYIHMNKLYSTIGINGLNEAARFLGMKVSNNEEYIEFLQFILGTIKEQNKIHSIHNKKRPFLFNSEVVPAEGLGGKNYRWDKADGYWVPEDKNLYNSYFFDAHDPNTSVLDKFILHGRKTYQYTDGGSACHVNLDNHLSKSQYLKLIDFAIQEGTNYFTFNIPNSRCEDCGYITKRPIHECPICGSKKIKWYTRVIGFLRAIDNFGIDRFIEAGKRFYNNGKKELC